MSNSAHHQTISYLGRRLSETGVRLNPRHGQNFLIDQNLLQMIAKRATIGPHDVVLEIGTGTGALTAIVASRAGAVVSVELDPRLHQLATEELAGMPNVLLMSQDALRNKSTLDPRLIAVVEEQLAAAPGRQLKLVANLPYSVATPVIANLLASTIAPVSMTVTIQKELADRITAAPETRDYGALSVWVQCQSNVERVRTLPPSVFWPRPRVTSAIVHIDVIDKLRHAIPDLQFFQEFVRSLFVHRRKYLRSGLESGWHPQLDKLAVDAILIELGISLTARAEQLPVEAILALAETVRTVISSRNPSETIG